MTAPACTQVTVATPDGAMPARLWVPPRGRGPGLVVVQEIFGVSDYIQRRSADLAAQGYVVLAPEVYWRLDDQEIDEHAEDALQQGMSVASRVDWESAVKDLRAAFTGLRERPEVTGDVGLLGFCFGGGLAFNVAAYEDPKVLVSYYGSALPGLLDLADRVKAASLHHFGLADSFIAVEEVERIRAAVTRRANAIFLTYADANHAFDNPTLPMLYNPRASQLAWTNTLEFLARELPVQ